MGPSGATVAIVMYLTSLRSQQFSNVVQALYAATELLRNKQTPCGLACCTSTCSRFVAEPTTGLEVEAEQCRAGGWAQSSCFLLSLFHISPSYAPQQNSLDAASAALQTDGFISLEICREAASRTCHPRKAFLELTPTLHLVGPLTHVCKGAAQQPRPLLRYTRSRSFSTEEISASHGKD